MKVNERRKSHQNADGSVLFEDFDQFIFAVFQILQDASLASSESFCCRARKIAGDLPAIADANAFHAGTCS